MEELNWSQLKKRWRGRLPHWEVPGMTVFLTFRLHDSLPRHVVEAYREERRILLQRTVTQGESAQLRRDARLLFSERIESVLDSGMGGCALRDRLLADCTLDAFRHFDGERYVLHAACVMPNHAHVVMTLSPQEQLSKVTHSWKSYTGHWAKKHLGLSDRLWQEESYDHIVRHEEEFEHYVRYTLENPAKAGLKDWPHTLRGGVSPANQTPLA